MPTACSSLARPPSTSRHSCRTTSATSAPRLDDPAWAEDGQPPAGDEPIVLASLSTSKQDQLGLLRRIVDALGALPVRGVVTTGHAIDPEELPSPANVSVLRSAPHRAAARARRRRSSPTAATAP